MVDPIDILVAGGHGQVGQALAHAAWPRNVRLHRPTRSDLDLTGEAALSEAFRRTRFAAVINAAAFTAVDAAQEQAGDAFSANALIPARLADATRRTGIPLIQLSTDCVFDGRLDRPYAEDDATGPISVYGASKLAGEIAVLSANPRAVVVRTAWVVSARARNFVRTILEAAAERSELSVIADRVGSPTSADDLARALITLTTAMIADPAAPTGVYHCVNAGEASWADLATEAVRLAGLRTAIVPIPATDRPAAAPRPGNSRLSCQRLTRDHGVRMRDWRPALADIVADLKREKGAP
ncbi:MAG: dTDP-4-dehydrorhamnose reductase [Alphaproteobacteria bacterium]|nr:dTDP-4-dehydrorhamnose reductase [Alphaproteobacteria bacterium]MBU2379022.1 dTDP-4-dehydrorhamnose reductase [Alphaproteobacteria bacterium]